LLCHPAVSQVVTGDGQSLSLSYRASWGGVKAYCPPAKYRKLVTILGWLPTQNTPVPQSLSKILGLRTSREALSLGTAASLLLYLIVYHFKGYYLKTTRKKNE